MIYEDKPLSLRILLPAGEIPSGSVVTKRTGEKEYTLVQEVTIYGPEKNQERIIKSDENSRFLDSGNGQFNAVGSQTLLLWRAERWELQEYLEGADQ